GVAVLAVVGDVDADLPLPAHHLNDALAQPAVERRLVGGLADQVRPVELDQIGRPGQAAGMAGQNAVAASPHPGLPSSSPDLTPGRISSGFMYSTRICQHVNAPRPAVYR